MPLSYAEITDYATSLDLLIDRAKESLGMTIDDYRYLDPPDVVEQLRIVINGIIEKYGVPASELGAQWYDTCAAAAGVKTDAAILSDINYTRADKRVLAITAAYLSGEEDIDAIYELLMDMVEDEVRIASRDQIMNNIQRDNRADRRSGYNRGVRYARVPVGETCAWCFMLASRGYVYLSYESAGGLDPDHYHPHCDCVVVAHNDPLAISGYGDQYKQYERMYQEAKDALAYGTISDELSNRIEDAKERHNAKYEAGELNTTWSEANEIAMVMREQNHLEH